MTLSSERKVTYIAILIICWYKMLVIATIRALRETALAVLSAPR